jgi:hypothetical protein
METGNATWPASFNEAESAKPIVPPSGKESPGQATLSMPPLEDKNTPVPVDNGAPNATWLDAFNDGP